MGSMGTKRLKIQLGEEFQEVRGGVHMELGCGGLAGAGQNRACPEE